MAEITFELFGQTKAGKNVQVCTLKAGDYMAQVLTLGGTLRSFVVPAADGKRDIVQGCDTPEQYEEQSHTNYFGAIVGRVANRITQASFELNGKTYSLAANQGTNCLHGGINGFNRAVWDAKAEDGALVLTYVSADGEEGFPGNLNVQVTYRLSEEGTLTIEYDAESDKDTLCNMTNHSYFNLCGHAFGSLEGHRLQILADEVTSIDESGAPDGKIFSVEKTPFDLREPQDLAEKIEEEHPQLTTGGGFDHNFILGREKSGPIRVAARAYGGGLCMDCRTTQPGVQLYTSNFLTPMEGKGGTHYDRRSSFCLETQGWADAIHHPDFPSIILRAGEHYHQITEYKVTKCLL